MHSNRRKALGIVLALLLALSYFSPMQQALRTLPGTIALSQGQPSALKLPKQLTFTGDTLPRAVASSQDETLLTRGQTDTAPLNTRLTLKLMGLVPMKTVSVQVSPEKRVIPGGMTVGVAMRTSGVLVVGTGSVRAGSSPALQGEIRPGDVLLEVGDVPITSAEQLSEVIAGAGLTPLSVSYLRDGQRLNATLTPELDEATGTFRLGLWVRDSTAGIGTLSFYDPDTGRYAALGHAITDGDTGQVLSVSDGQLLRADIVAVQKGARGAPGELKGSFLKQADVLGSICENNVLGIYGTLEKQLAHPLYPDGLPVGLRGGVHTGAASILATVDGSGMQEFSIVITRVTPQDKPAPKSMVIRVTDERLLALTGGIVQGMSGSPILQDGRIIGAVTHVHVPAMIPISDPRQ